jgi:hypothetical protein
MPAWRITVTGTPMLKSPWHIGNGIKPRLPFTDMQREQCLASGGLLYHRASLAIKLPSTKPGPLLRRS